MRNCENCCFSGFGLDCNTGIETLYCSEDNYEFEVQLEDSCDLHQFIDGMANEKNYLLYDETYFGKGYLIINLLDQKITKFLKLYIINDGEFPSYGLRAFSINEKNESDIEINNIEYVFRNLEDFDNGLFDAFLIFGKKINNSIQTIDEIRQVGNRISVNIDKGIIKLICSKDIYSDKQYSSDYIDINLSDNFTCQNYEAFNDLYNFFVSICPTKEKQDDIKKLVMTRLRQFKNV